MTNRTSRRRWPMWIVDSWWIPAPSTSVAVCPATLYTRITFIHIRLFSVVGLVSFFYRLIRSVSEWVNIYSQRLYKQLNNKANITNRRSLSVNQTYKHTKIRFIEKCLQNARKQPGSLLIQTYVADDIAVESPLLMIPQFLAWDGNGIVRSSGNCVSLDRHNPFHSEFEGLRKELSLSLQFKQCHSSYWWYLLTPDRCSKYV